MSRDALKQLFLELADILEPICTYFLIQGTALGAYRDGDFTPSETDIDIGFLWEDFTEAYQEIHAKLTEADFSLLEVVEPFNKPRILLASKYGVRADLVSFMRWQDKRFALTPIWYDNYAIVHNAALLETIESVQLFDRPFFVPSPITEYLEAEYGSTWQTPQDDNVSRVRVYNFLEVSGIDTKAY